MDKGPGLLLLPFVNIGIPGTIRSAAVYRPQDTRRPRARANDESAAYMASGIDILFLFSLSCWAWRSAAGIPVDMNRMITNGMLILFLIIGNFMGNLRPNYFAGIRTPWTLDDPEIWRATHRIGARILFYGCLALLLLQWLLNGEQLLFLSLGLLIGCSIWSIAYSYFLFHRKNRTIP